MFTGGSGAGANPPPQQPDAEGVFADVFEEVRTRLTLEHCQLMFLFSFFDLRLRNVFPGGHMSVLYQVEV